MIDKASLIWLNEKPNWRCTLSYWFIYLLLFFFVIISFYDDWSSSGNKIDDMTSSVCKNVFLLLLDSTDNLKINLWWSLVFAKVLDSFVYYIAWFSKALGWTSVVIRHPMFYWRMSCTFNDLKLYSWVARTLSWSFLLIGVPMFLPSYSVRTSEKPLKILRVFLLKTNVFVLF